MLTWILIAIIVAALFGLINFDQIREWGIAKSKEAWPHVRHAMSWMGEKIESAKAKVESSHSKINDNLDKAKDKVEEYKDDAKDKFDDYKD